MIVITNPFSIENEFQIIHQLFEEGLRLLHVRKPAYSENEMRSFFSNIDERFYSKLVLHEQSHLAHEFKINRIHLKKKTVLRFQIIFKKQFRIYLLLYIILMILMNCQQILMLLF